MTCTLNDNAGQERERDDDEKYNGVDCKGRILHTYCISWTDCTYAAQGWNSSHGVHDYGRVIQEQEAMNIG